MLALLCAVTAPHAASAQDAAAPLKQNWFDDHYFRVSAGLPG